MLEPTVGETSGHRISDWGHSQEHVIPGPRDRKQDAKDLGKTSILPESFEIDFSKALEARTYDFIILDAAEKLAEVKSLIADAKKDKELIDPNFIPSLITRLMKELNSVFINRKYEPPSNSYEIARSFVLSAWNDPDISIINFVRKI